MNVIVKFITAPVGENLQNIIDLWRDVFGDNEKFITDVLSSDNYAGAAVAMCDGHLVGMAHLLRLENEKNAYYCYAVATNADYRGNGIGKKMMICLVEKCNEENYALLLHPAEASLELFYKKLGFSSLAYTYEIFCEGDGGDYYEISPSEYKLQRNFQFGGYGYYGWSEEILSLSGLRFIGFDIDGEFMCAAVSEQKVCEFCAPPHMLGKAARRAANLAKKMLVFETNPVGADVAVMGYNASEYSYFNLFLD